MLKKLHISNFALISLLDMDFNRGFSVITGETGAGKSIILGAINLLMGQRAESRQIKAGAKKCVIEATFDLSAYAMQQFFQDNDIEYDDTDCIMRRELSATGKSRSFINDTPVPLSLMKELGEQLIDIHSQHKNLMLGSTDFQLQVVDILAANATQRQQYATSFATLQQARKAVARMKEQMAQAAQNEEFMKFQLAELQAANLQPGMQDELERETEKLSHVEEIKAALTEADAMMQGADGEAGAVERLKNAWRAVGSVSNVFGDAAEMASRMENCMIELKDIANDIARSAEGVDFDPRRLDEANAQLDRIYALQQKHRTDSVEHLLEIQADLTQKLDALDNSDGTLALLQEEELKALEQCRKEAALLTATRQKAARKLEEGMKERLVPLGIPKVRFSVDIQSKELSADGADTVAFLFSANSSTEMQPVSQVASGGEIARVMLSVKAMISNAVKLPTIVFDEIDTGVSGKTAEMMAVIMEQMARTDRQVISITHLPQIAARGKSHYRVYKEETAEGTVSHMKMLTPEERVDEIAQMLSGSDITEAARSNARELIEKARA